MANSPYCLTGKTKQFDVYRGFLLLPLVKANEASDEVEKSVLQYHA